MKKNLFFFVFALIALPRFGFSQRTWSLELSGGPDFCYRFLRPTGGASDEIVKTQLNSLESARWGFSISESAVFAIGQRGELRAGLQFIVHRLGQAERELRFPDSSTVRLSVIESVRMAALPLSYRHHVGGLGQRASFFWEAGLSAQSLLAWKTRHSLDSRQIGAIDQARSNFAALQGAATVGLGVRFRASERMAVWASAGGMAQLVAINRGTLKHHLTSTGLRLGIAHKL